jgi:hypothetical protein
MEAKLRGKESELQKVRLRLEECRKEVKSREEKVIGLVSTLRRLQAKAREAEQARSRAQDCEPALAEGLSILNITAE